ncbi:hypothetical protein [Streptomyces sp. SAI-25]|uniref:hypothetical protein n=1 Tax=Streptomyces sp. SAI-25 TaxID=1472664 RepID=UPI00403A0D1E
MAGKDKTTDAKAEKDRGKWMARFQVRLVVQPGVDRAVILQAVKEVTAHCAETGTHPRTEFGDPDAYGPSAGPGPGCCRRICQRCTSPTGNTVP